MNETRTETSTAGREARPISTPDHDLQRELESQRAAAKQLQRLAEAISAGTTLQGLCEQLLDLCLESVGAALGVIRVRDSADLRSIAALGLDEEVTNTLTLPSTTAFAGMEPVAPG